MNEHDATEQAYKRGYEDGKRDAVKRGHWVVKHIKNRNYRYCFCSECQTMGDITWKCCPFCEAKMDGGCEDDK